MKQEVAVDVASGVAVSVVVVIAEDVAVVVDLIGAAFILGGDCVPTTSISKSESEGEDGDDFPPVWALWAEELTNTAAADEIVVVEVIVFNFFTLTATEDRAGCR